MTEVEISQEQPAAGTNTTYGWLASLPLVATAGSAVYNAYEGSKNYNCVTQYALGTVESSVKMAASAVAPVVRKLDKPIQAVDSFTASKLAQLEEKVPAVKSQPEEVVTYVTETKEALANKVIEGRAAISTRFSESKDRLTSQITSGKEVVYSKLSAGSEAVIKSRAGMAVTGGKQVLASRLAQGKEAIGNTIASGRDAVYTKIHNGTDYLANTRAGSLVGSGVDSTLTTTENWVDYFFPEIENEKELFECEVKEEDVAIVGLPRTRRFSDDSPAQDEEEPQAATETPVGRVDRVYTLSRKVKLRMYFHSMQRLQSMQKNCQSTLLHLKQSVDLLKLAQATRDGMDLRYQSVTSALKDLEQQLKQLLSHQSKVGWPSKSNDGDDDDEVKVDWITPKSQGIMQSSLDHATQLSEKVFQAFKSVSVATTYLPDHLRNGATQGYQYAQEMYSTLR